MLTVKVMSPGGDEEIHDGLSVGFNPKQQSIAVSGMEQNIFLDWPLYFHTLFIT